MTDGRSTRTKSGVQSICSTGRIFPSVGRTVHCFKIKLRTVGGSGPTWYSMMASRRSSASSHAARRSASFSWKPAAPERSDRDCSSSLIPSRALVLGKHAERPTKNGWYSLKQYHSPLGLTVTRGTDPYLKSIQSRKRGLDFPPCPWSFL